MCVQGFMFWALDVVLNGGITIMLEACIDEDLAHEKGLHYMVYVVFSYW